MVWKYHKCRDIFAIFKILDIFKILPLYNFKCSFNRYTFEVIQCNSVFTDYYQLHVLHEIFENIFSVNPVLIQTLNMLTAELTWS